MQTPSRLLLAVPMLFVLALSAMASEPLRYDRVNLGSSAQTEVDNDTLVAVLTAQAEGRDATIPADEVNRQMDWAVTVATSLPDVKVQTLGYRTQPVYDKSKIHAWRVSQSLRLESGDARLLGDLVARLQEQLRVQSLGYEISDERRRRHRDQLTDTALARFQARAERIARAMGRSGYRLVQIHINDGHQQPAPMARAMMLEAAAADVAPARIEPGTRTLSVTVNGEIELSTN